VFCVGVVFFFFFGWGGQQPKMANWMTKKGGGDPSSTTQTAHEETIGLIKRKIIIGKVFSSRTSYQLWGGTGRKLSFAPSPGSLRTEDSLSEIMTRTGSARRGHIRERGRP